eukprot:scaffold165709_cov32-Tisochrysis_lutea.AAC.1
MKQPPPLKPAWRFGEVDGESCSGDSCDGDNCDGESDGEGTNGGAVTRRERRASSLRGVKRTPMPDDAAVVQSRGAAAGASPNLSKAIPLTSVLSMPADTDGAGSPTEWKLKAVLKDRPLADSDTGKLPEEMGEPVS